MRPIDADALIDSLDKLEAANGKKIYRQALNDALHDFFPQIIAAEPTISPPPNDPLTLEQLREMGGEAVWVESLEGIRKSGFGIVHLCPPPSLGVVRKIWIFGGESEFWQDIPWPRSKKRQEYGKRWIAYRRKPEEET